MLNLLKNRYFVLAALACLLVVQVYETTHIHSCCWQVGRGPLNGHSSSSHDGHNCGGKFWTSGVLAPSVAEFGNVTRMDARLRAPSYASPAASHTTPRAPPL